MEPKMIHLPDKEKESKSEGLYKRLSKLWRFDFNFPYIAIQLRDINTKEILDNVKILIQYPVTPRVAYFMLLQAQKNMHLKFELMKQSFPFFFGPTPSNGPQLSLLELYQTYFIEIDHKKRSYGLTSREAIEHMKKINSKKPEKSEKKTLDKIRFARINKSKRYKPLPVIEEVSQSESDTSM